MIAGILVEALEVACQHAPFAVAWRLGLVEHVGHHAIDQNYRYEIRDGVRAHAIDVESGTVEPWMRRCAWGTAENDLEFALLALSAFLGHTHWDDNRHWLAGLAVAFRLVQLIADLRQRLLVEDSVLPFGAVAFIDSNAELLRRSQTLAYHLECLKKRLGALIAFRKPLEKSLNGFKVRGIIEDLLGGIVLEFHGEFAAHNRNHVVFDEDTLHLGPV